MKNFTLRNKTDWAFITISDSHGVLVMIHSSFGSWGYNWASPGDDYVRFLKTTSVGYAFDKFSNTQRLAAAQRIINREFRDFQDFHGRFWNQIIEHLEKKA
jgi:hypothetical protein